MKSYEDTLIRLYDNGASSSKAGLVFDNNFNQDIEINPGAQIAFTSLSIPHNNNSIIIDGSNDQLDFQVTGSAGGQFQTSLPHRPDGITKDNADQFFRDMTDVMNAQLRTINTATGANNTKQIGQKILARPNSQEKKMEIVFKHGGTTAVNSKAATDHPGIQEVHGLVNQQRPRVSSADGTNRAWKRTAGTSAIDIGPDAGGVAGYVGHTEPINTACGVFDAYVLNLKFDDTNAGTGDANKCGLFIGLTQDLDKLKAGTLGNDDCDFAIRVQKPKRAADAANDANTIQVKTSKATNFVNSTFHINEAELNAIIHGGGGGVGQQSDLRDNPRLGFVVESDATNSRTSLKFIKYEQLGANGLNPQTFTRRLMAQIIDLPLRDPLTNKDLLYYPVIGVLGSRLMSSVDASFVNDEAFNMWGNVRYNPDPFRLYQDNLNDNQGSSNTDNENALTDPYPMASKQITSYNVTIHPDVAKFLGYTGTQSGGVLGPIIAQDADFLAGLAFSPINNADTFIVESLSLPLKTFDGLTLFEDQPGQLQQFSRRNVLYYIPESETILSEDTGILQYESPEKIFLDIQNKNKMLVRNLKIRVTDQNYVALSTHGPSSVVIVIRNYN